MINDLDKNHVLPFGQNLDCAFMSEEFDLILLYGALNLNIDLCARSNSEETNIDQGKSGETPVM